MDRYTLKWTSATVKLGEARSKVVNDALCKAMEGVKVDVVGSFMQRTALCSQDDDETNPTHVDMIATIPSSLCTLDDIQSGAYLQRRSELIDSIVEILQTTVSANDEQGEDAPLVPSAVSKGLYSGDPHKAFAKVQFGSHVDAKHCAHQRNDSGTFSEIRIHVRPAAVPAQVVAAKAMKKKKHYANLLLEDFNSLDQANRILQLARDPQTVRAIIFLKSWARHWGLVADGVQDSLTGHVIACLLACLVEEGIVSPGMTSENMVRSAWVQLSQKKFCGERKDETPCPKLTLAGTNANVLFRLSNYFLATVVQNAAATALHYSTAADAIAGPHLSYVTRADLAFWVEGLPQYDDSGNGDENQRHVHSEMLQSLLERAFQTRVSEAFADYSSSGTALVLLCLVSEAAGRTRLLRGPPIEDTAAVGEFNAFWGTACTSTRQFPDGGIHRCVLWDPPAAECVTSAWVAKRILKHVLTLHLQCSPSYSMQVLGDQIHDVLDEYVDGVWKDANCVVETRVKQASAELVKAVSGAMERGLPCKLISTDVISATERGVEPYPTREHLALLRSTDSVPEGVSTAPTIDPIYTVVTFDDKKKIPDAPEAVTKMKGAILAQLAKTLQDVDGMLCLCSPTFLDIIHRGFLFRIYLAHFREVSMLRALQRSIEADVLERRLFWSTQHASFVRSMSQSHPSFATTVRIAKRWVGAMMMVDFVLPEAIELLVAYVYQRNQDTPSHLPKTPHKSFPLFLQLLASFPWQQQVLCFPFVDADAAERSKAECMKSAGESAPAMWIAAPYAPQHSPFTISTPRAPILSRLVEMAKKALTLFTRALVPGPTKAREDNVAGSFSCDPKTFDFVLSFADPVVTRPDRCIHIKRETSQGHLTPHRIWRLDEIDGDERQKYILLLADMDPAAHSVRTVRKSLRNDCMVFYDGYGPQQLGCVLLSDSPSPKEIHAVKHQIMALTRGALVDTPECVDTPQTDGKRGKKKRKGEGTSSAKHGKKARHDSASAQ